MNRIHDIATRLLLGVALAACGAERAAPPIGGAPPAGPLAVVLAPQGGTTAIDRRVADLQQRIARTGDGSDVEGRQQLLEQLGRAFVHKARTESDDGCFRLAGLCAEAMSAAADPPPAALLLQGYVLHQQHEFGRALAIAERLVAARGDFADLGLLGDVQLDRGDLAAAARSYQAMLEQKPCLQSYARAARLRRLTGDIAGARRLLDLAMGAGSPRDPEALAWVHTDRSRLELEAGALAAADLAARAALQVLDDYPPALLAQGRVALARDDAGAAVPLLQRAAAVRPQPEYLWALLEALSVSDRAAADRVRVELRRTGAGEDPRTFALWLAGEALDAGAEAGAADAALALRLAAAELQQRQDAATLDAQALALLAAGRVGEAEQAAQQALLPGGDDPRRWLCTGLLALAAGDRDAARRRLERAAAHAVSLLPSERRRLDAAWQRL